MRNQETIDRIISISSVFYSSIGQWRKVVLLRYSLTALTASKRVESGHENIKGDYASNGEDRNSRSIVNVSG